MKKYKMEDWLKIYNDSGHSYITGINLTKDLIIETLEITNVYGNLTGFGRVSAKRVFGIEGDKQFVLEDDGSVSLLVDSTEKKKSSLKTPTIEFKNKKVIPLSKWIDAIIFNRNKIYQNKEDWYRHIEVVGCETDDKGFIKNINTIITYNDNYGEFGSLEIESKFKADDVLKFTYGMYRNDVCDEWIGKCYFNENFDLVFNDDGLYHILCPEQCAKIV